MKDNKQKIRFIINPRSGANRKRNLPVLIEKNLDHGRWDAEICLTEYAGHAIQLAKEAADHSYEVVVACGGDGSVNEISSQLIGTQTVLGVVPSGSGNGFAGHLGIGRDVERAIQLLNHGKVIVVDTCRMNGRPFVNLAGIGFDGVVSKRLHDSPVRGLWAYLRYTLEEAWAYKMQQLDIQVDGEKISRRCLLVEVANAPVYGYGFSIVPHADFNDGKLEVLVIKAAPKWRYILESWRFLNHSFHKSSLAECYTCREVVVTPKTPTCYHIDGEGYELKGEARFDICPNSLRVLVPKAFGEILR
ncbi:MAG: diacylglycerol kinase family lipid kinase [Saprospiraceae bacterium]|nr:diacylglycerol kinase family lipid kinase [Saprospiraceae bacterium]MCF8251262.1 diacylglycerol kinase family lipid kinase [Saprospiraceae bacterium]MCF8280847.1 diacylglycerol kinase family lipid kinase [Bacteroidales bacterium]MCF8311799.1 diacylglycerol kinase family lipid kinase [Saprospiraceae bacterium]MCF8441940.1 diacylglycerol kinase family lipid kinase [Saprospiraceae bacterium]